ncbi:MAG: Uncharacterized protein CEN87_699 [Parcubacteria group bacterium Licking1014_1]|nr:MAG: Uncharacterized protein CEN87_699 [Parcubacteria group bacterium Licking1014_1]
MFISKYYILVFAFLFVLLAHSASAAVIYILPEQGNFSRGETISIDVKIDSEGESVNAAQAKINWTASALEFVEASKDGSAFNFWIEEPVSSSASNSISFTGGTAKGISGAALQVFKIKFKAMGAGTAEISISDAAVTASDGKGTNVLSKVKGASYRVGLEGIQPELPKSTTVPTSQPVKVERQAIVGQGLPQKPEIKVPQYSDEKQWHNYLGEVVALWNVPPDVTAVATTLNHSPNTVPYIAEKELTTGRSFGILEDGIWYIHARFQNNISWGPVAHYRIAIDTKPPLPFELSIPEGETTDNPAPIIRFKSSDALSGLKEYEIKIDDKEAIKIPAAEFIGNFTLPLQPPGTHRVIVKAIDEAGNSVEDSIAIEILPIPSPTITFVTRELFLGEQQGLTVKGTGLPNINVLLRVEQVLARGKGEVVAKRTAQTDDKGNWEFTFDNSLRNGRYVVTVQSQDERGALSLTVESQEILVKSKPIIQIGVFQLGMGGAALLLLLLLVLGFGSGVWFYKKRQQKLSLRVEFAGSEITKIFKLIKADVEKLLEAFKTPTTGDDEYTLKQLRENITKMELYLKKGIEKIKK